MHAVELHFGKINSVNLAEPSDERHDERHHLSNRHAKARLGIIALLSLSTSIKHKYVQAHIIRTHKYVQAHIIRTQTQARRYPHMHMYLVLGRVSYQDSRSRLQCVATAQKKYTCAFSSDCYRCSHFLSDCYRCIQYMSQRLLSLQSIFQHVYVSIDCYRCHKSTSLELGFLAATPFKKTQI